MEHYLSCVQEKHCNNTRHTGRWNISWQCTYYLDFLTYNFYHEKVQKWAFKVASMLAMTEKTGILATQ